MLISFLGFNMTREEAKKTVLKTTDGIDKDECEYDNGWWETSDGAKFGKGKLDELLLLVDKIYDDFDEEIKEYVERMDNISTDCITEIKKLENDFKSRICQNCEYIDRERPV